MDFRELWELYLHEDCGGGADLDFTTDGAPMELGVRLRHYTFDITDQPELLVTCIDDFRVEIANPWSINECVEAAQPGDLCPDDPDKTDPSTCGCGVADTDSDVASTCDCSTRRPIGSYRGRTSRATSAIHTHIVDRSSAKPSRPNMFSKRCKGR